MCSLFFLYDKEWCLIRVLSILESYIHFTPLIILAQTCWKHWEVKFINIVMNVTRTHADAVHGNVSHILM